MPDLEMLMRLKKIRKSEVAYVLGVSEMTIRRWLRKYNPEHHKKIMDAIEKIEERGDGYD